MFLDGLDRRTRRRPPGQGLVDVDPGQVQPHREHRGEPADRAGQVRPRHHLLLPAVALDTDQHLPARHPDPAATAINAIANAVSNPSSTLPWNSSGNVVSNDVGHPRPAHPPTMPTVAPTSTAGSSGRDPITGSAPPSIPRHKSSSPTRSTA